MVGMRKRGRTEKEMYGLSEDAIKLIFIILGVFFLIISLISASNTVNFSLALFFTLVCFSIAWYPFRSIYQVIALLVAWFLSIYGMIDIVSGGIFKLFTYETYDIGAWLLVFPGVYLLREIAKKVFDKYTDWSITSMAALDSLFLISVVLVATSGIISIESLKMNIWLSENWRFVFTPGVGLLLWVAYFKEKYYDVFPHKEKLTFSKFATSLIFVSGLYLTLQSALKYFFLSELSILVFLAEGIIGLILMYVSYNFVYIMRKFQEE